MAQVILGRFSFSPAAMDADAPALMWCHPISSDTTQNAPLSLSLSLLSLSSPVSLVAIATPSTPMLPHWHQCHPHQCQCPCFSTHLTMPPSQQMPTATKAAPAPPTQPTAPMPPTQHHPAPPQPAGGPSHPIDTNYTQRRKRQHAEEREGRGFWEGQRWHFALKLKNWSAPLD